MTLSSYYVNHSGVIYHVNFTKSNVKKGEKRKKVPCFVRIGIVNPCRTAVPFWRQTNSCNLSPKRDCGSIRLTLQGANREGIYSSGAFLSTIAQARTTYSAAVSFTLRAKMS